ncbi:cytosolic carboxypeptidase 2 [Dromaius novaehollandiae]|uniref:cytosolic carboxypeptidase 2 n=1 Tax=Dromaius novaehollandiae TaxID=8790 RepID=UPI00311D3F94
MHRHLRYYGYFGAPRVLKPALRKSKQLPLGRPPDCGSPLLREPRALFALLSARGPLPAPRWPVECEVVEEAIKHIEWVPPQPEPFYQPMGHEQAPASSEEHGTVVYHISPGTIGDSCFTRARVGGAQGPLSSPAATLAGPHDTTLLFESRFESGNLQKAVKVGAHEYVLTLRPDLYTSKHTQWFYFRVQNTRKDPVYRFTITNLAKPKSLYGEGMKPLLYSQRDAQSHGIGWHRAGDDIRYYRGGSEEGRAAYCLTWTVRFPHDGDTCYFAHSYPYTYSDLQRYLQEVVGDPVRSQYCKVRALCRSLAGNTVYLLTISSPAGAAAKRMVVLSARVHPGESGGSWVMRGFLDFILSDAPEAQLLRQLFIFKVVPMLNPDGVVVGNSRCSLAGRDLNRAYRTVLKDSFPCVWHTRAMVERVLAEREILLYCDFHGHSRKNNVFMYGCSGSGASAMPRLHERIFPLMLSKNAPDKFSFRSCKFKVQKSKEGTGRIVMWRMGISNSYTMETAFGGSTLGERHSHFSVEDLKSLGHHICDTLLDFCNPDAAKVQQCLLELDELLKQQLHQKLGCKSGSSGSWSGVSLLDLESSTSGSNSSESDGPPAHLRGLAEQLKQRKKKRLQTRRERNALRQRYTISRDRLSRESISGERRHPRSRAAAGDPHLARREGGSIGAVLGCPTPASARRAGLVALRDAALREQPKSVAANGATTARSRHGQSQLAGCGGAYRNGTGHGTSCVSLQAAAPGAMTRLSLWRGELHSGHEMVPRGSRMRSCLSSPPGERGCWPHAKQCNGWDLASDPMGARCPCLARRRAAVGGQHATAALSLLPARNQLPCATRGPASAPGRKQPSGHRNLSPSGKAAGASPQP